jgi:hypothetical protein
MSSEENIDNLRMEKQNAFDSLYEKYKLSSFYHSFNNLGNQNHLLNLQEKNMVSNKTKLKNIQSDIDTLEKQVLLSNNEFFLRENQIKILKVVFYFLLLTLGNIILHKTDIIPTNILYILQILLTIIFGIILVVQAKWNRIRNINDFRIFNWDISSETTPGSEEETIIKCRPKTETKSETISENSKTKINIII